MRSDEQPERKNPVLVSVVTPAYNAMPYIEETVQSVRGQDYPSIEHIVMDGGSKDGTVDYLKEQEYLTWESQPDRGQSHALNKGFELARGEIIGWLNADDVYLPGAINRAVTFLMEHESVDLVYGDLEIIDQAGDFVGRSKSRNFELEGQLIENLVHQPTVFMRKRVLDQVKGVDEGLHYTMDRELWLRAGIEGIRMHYLQGQTLAAFRICAGTKTYDDAPEFRLEWYLVLKGLIDLGKDMQISMEERRSAMTKTKSQYHIAKVIQALEHRDRVAIFRELFEALRQDTSLVLNRGTWKFAGMGVLGIKPDRLSRFRKNTKS